jgi:hypothetical protein
METEIVDVKELKILKKKKPKKVKEKNYLNNKDLYNEIVTSLEQAKLTPRAEKMFIILSEKVSTKMQYRNPDDKKDCIAFSQLDLFRYWKGFNPKYLNAFAYFTEIAKKGLAKGWNNLYPKKYKNTISIDGSSSSTNNYDDNTSGNGLYSYK